MSRLRFAHGRRLMVVDPGKVRDDLVEDMMEVLTSFCARLYGRRSAWAQIGKEQGTKSAPGGAEMMRTYPSRPRLTTESEVALAAYAVGYSRAERCLFSHLSTGEDAGQLKWSFLREHDLTARQFNALAFSVKWQNQKLDQRTEPAVANPPETPFVRRPLTGSNC